MTVTLTITDPTADESRAVRAYLDSLHAEAPYVQMTGRGARTPPLEIDTSVDLAEGFDEQPRRIENTFENATAEECGVPTAEAPVTAADAGAPDFDSAGMPWDERIHASSRATVADGTWRKKRGVSPEEVERVEAELTQEGTADPVTTEVPEAPVGESTAPSVTEPDTSTPTETSAPVPPADAPPPPPAAAPNPFLAVMSRIGKSKLDKAKKDELLTAAGALDDKGNPSILVLNKRPELIDGFVALLDSEGV